MKRTLEQVQAAGGYKIIYADNPWSYAQGGRGTIEDKYEGMSPDDICDLPVWRLASRDAVLFTWGTWPCLPEVLQSIKSWEFDYKTIGFVWVKYREPSKKHHVGTGFWTRANTEFCLVATRGKNYPRRIDKGVRQLVETDFSEPEEILEAPLGKHSAKPAIVRDRIVQLMGDLPRIELFARCVDANGKVIPGGRVAPGWAQWGNECDSDVILLDSDVRSGLTVSPLVERSSERETERDNDGDERNTDHVIAVNHENEEETDMANLPKEILDQVSKARVAGGGVYIQHGDYVMMIKKWFYQKIQDECIILELVPVESKKKIVYEGDKKIEEEPNAPGSECSSTANFDGNGKQSAGANSRAPVLGLFGFKEGQIPDDKVGETLAYVVSDAQPAKGMLVLCSTFPKEIRSNKGNYITGLNWDFVAKPGDGLNSAAAVKDRLDAFTKGSDELLKVVGEQLRVARAAGMPALGAPAATSGAPANQAAPSLPSSAPSLPAGGAPALPAKKDPLEGWTVHPQDANYYYKDNILKTKADILAGVGL